MPIYMYQGNILWGSSNMEDYINLENSVLGRIVHKVYFCCFKNCLRKHNLSIQIKRAVLRRLTFAVHSQEINLFPECIKTWLLEIYT